MTWCRARRGKCPQRPMRAPARPSSGWGRAGGAPLLSQVAFDRLRQRGAAGNAKRLPGLDGPWVTRPGLGRWSRGDAEAPMWPALPLPSRASRAPTWPGRPPTPRVAVGGGGHCPSPGWPRPLSALRRNPLPLRRPGDRGRRPPRPRAETSLSFVPEAPRARPERRWRELRLHLAKSLVSCVSSLQSWGFSRMGGRLPELLSPRRR